MSSGPEHLDELDRRIILALQADGRATWTEIAERCQTSVTTVARRGQQLLRDGIVRVAVMPDVEYPGAADLFVLRITCEPGTQKRVLARLADRADLRFLALVTGPADIIAELSLRRGDSLHARIVEEIQAIEGVQRCDTDLTLHVYKVSHDWGQQLVVPGTPDTVAEVHKCAPGHFDAADEKIIDFMQEDGRASFRAVAKALGVDESTVRRRFEVLQRRGCISVVTLVSAPALGFESEIIFNITVDPARLDSLAHELGTHRGVRYVAATLNRNALFCEVILPTTDDVHAFTTRVLGRLDGVQGWTASMVLLTIRRGFVETPWWRDNV
ncbi:Lrp/AsnC family transcriptional regulator [Micromonospora sp. WMMD956]|uniref:Lrp/AsnC family transcriptional regulator n=1 Tax=Micromonospora TaxID=1873 RepID=UPI0024169C68|nr:Lrp/AsnC family transcriptional regulator [Micromonospora sp. WMMD956]MDG4819297.1 Lrp/AsnC family transcriptional regulator [Micromonospora sp. WMMD956]